MQRLGNSRQRLRGGSSRHTRHQFWGPPHPPLGSGRNGILHGCRRLCRLLQRVIGARLAGVEARGTMPHALIITIGDTVAATLAFDKHMPPSVPRVSLVDTFKDEVEESVRVARALGERLNSVRLDTPIERGRVTADLVKEVRVAAGLGRLQAGGHFCQRRR